jgi:hypothetical protein
MRSQRGLAAATIVIVLILTGVVLLLGRSHFRSEAILDQREVTDSNLRRVSDTLVQFASLNQRLPCPAAGNSDSGTEDATSPFTTCNSPDGVVPWAALSLRRDHALDGWGRKISYRVYFGPVGFTQAGGVNMTRCNTSLGFPLDMALDPGGLCKSGSPPPNVPIQFFGARGNMLVVEDSGTTRNGNAFVLVSHGRTGNGAFPAEGATVRTGLALLNPTGREFTNTQATGTTWILPHSAPDTVASDPAHFDDIVTYIAATDLVTRAKLAGRSWAELNAPLSAVFSLPSVSAAAPGRLGENTGQNYLGMGGFFIMGTDSTSTLRNIGIRTEDGIAGIGVVGGGSSAGDLNSALGERLFFLLGSGSEFHKMDIALNRFRVVDLGPPRLEERAEVTFWRGGDLIQTTTVTSWVEPIQPARCLFSLVSPGVFDRMDIRPIPRTGDGGQTTFSVAAIKACTEATASCTVDFVGALDCPARPPSAASTAAPSITATSATLNGLANDNGTPTNVSFDYGTTCSYPSNVAAAPASLSAGAGKTTITAPLTGLACNTSYYFRAKAVSAGGTTTGNDAMFTTSACAFPTPVASTGSASAVTQTSAFLSATVDANGADASVTFDAGTSNCYGTSLAATPGTVGAAAGGTAVSASLTGLSCGSRYHFRVRAVSAAGTTTGSDVGFTTAACP